MAFMNKSLLLIKPPPINYFSRIIKFDSFFAHSFNSRLHPESLPSLKHRELCNIMQELAANSHNA